jgi:N-acetylmuramoyl-L-alanine amidase
MKFRLKILKVSLFVLLVLTGVYIFHYAETGRNTIGGVEAENTVEDVNVAEKVVAIDSGHGGIDPGKIGVGGIYEKDVNLAISVKLKKLLEQSGITVIMTRSDDNGLYNESDTNKKASDMKKRCSIINESNADAVVSIHQNSYVSGESRGAQVFYYKKSEESKRIAQIMQGILGEKLGTTRQIKSDVNYYILLHSKLPTIISECGFLSNPEEEQRLCTEEYQEKVADALYCGIIEYLMMNMK